MNFSSSSGTVTLNCAIFVFTRPSTDYKKSGYSSAVVASPPKSSCMGIFLSIWRDSVKFQWLFEPVICPVVCFFVFLGSSLVSVKIT